MEYQIIIDANDKITNWVCCGLGFDNKWLGQHITFGFLLNGNLIGGLIFHDYRLNTDVWWTIYTTNKKWCNRNMLKFMFGVAFNRLHCRRINLLVNTSNNDCYRFVTKLGFKTEGLLRQYRENGEDCYFMGMLKNECKWF